MSGTSKNCAITNNTSSTNPKQVYGQTLKVLPQTGGGDILLLWHK